MFERLPVNVVGAVLNGIQAHGEYGYYGYVAGYEARDAEEPGTGSRHFASRRERDGSQTLKPTVHQVRRVRRARPFGRPAVLSVA